MGKGEFIDAAAESEDFPRSFTCSICLDLLYKPIVLSCGHISCFWCVHLSMNGMWESNCPICRHPYYHFPTVCQMLHFMLLKMYPVAYKRREEQTLAEEKETGQFSPQFDSNTSGSQGDQEYVHLRDFEHSSTTVSESNSCLEPCSSEKGEPNGNHKQLSIADVQCTGCQQLLFRPVFLNCGHGYCETCISCQEDDTLRCQVCQSLHPNGLPKVCWELNHFLEEQFPKDYALRRDAVQFKEANTPYSTRTSKEGFPLLSVSAEELLHSKLHLGIGCDSCGMYPIIGDRYRCIDCVERMGFDLCGDCYNTRSKLPGRFNQQHTSEHKFVRENSNACRILRRLDNEQFVYLSIASTNHSDPSEMPENEHRHPPVSNDAEENTQNSLTAADIHTESPDS